MSTVCIIIIPITCFFGIELIISVLCSLLCKNSVEGLYTLLNKESHLHCFAIFTKHVN